MPKFSILKRQKLAVGNRIWRSAAELTYDSKEQADADVVLLNDPEKNDRFEYTVVGPLPD